MKFDKIQIITSIRYISDIDNRAFRTNFQDENIISKRFKQTYPFDLIILTNESKHELLIEFTSKILKDDCHSLISSETIRACFDNINDMRICRLDIDSILHDSRVTKVDITKDISFDMSNLQQLLDGIRGSIKNYRRWNCNQYPAIGDTHGVVFQNVVSDRKYRKRLTIYDKHFDLGRATNRAFINSLQNPDEVMMRFRNTLRFELNVYTMAQIRSYLDIRSNGLMTVLEANHTNPIADILNDIIRDDVSIQLSKKNLKDMERLALIKCCDWDMKRVELLVREGKSKNQAISRAMLPYWEVYDSNRQSQHIKRTLLDLVA